MSRRAATQVRMLAASIGGTALAVGSGIACARWAPGSDEGAVAASTLLAPLLALVGAGWICAGSGPRSCAARSGATCAGAALLAATLWIRS
jgi:hypothetical protein